MAYEIELHSALEAILRIGDAMNATDWKRVVRAMCYYGSSIFPISDEAGQEYSLTYDAIKDGLKLIAKTMPDAEYSRQPKECAKTGAICLEYYRRHGGAKTYEEMKLQEVHSK